MKNYILDTNVLLHDPDALKNFQENHVLLPIEVIEEIDKFKRETSERGQNARTVSRFLDQLRSRGSLADGVPLEHGGVLRIIFADRLGRAGSEPGNGHHEVRPLPPPVIASGSVDNRILSLALAVRESDPDAPTILVTKDINLRLKADAYGLPAEDYETDRVNLRDLYTGMFEMVQPPARFLFMMRRTCGGSVPATANSTTPWMPCSTNASSWSRSWARPAPGRRCWPLRRG